MPQVTAIPSSQVQKEKWGVVGGELDPQLEIELPWSTHRH